MMKKLIFILNNEDTIIMYIIVFKFVYVIEELFYSFYREPLFAKDSKSVSGVSVE